MNQMRELFLEKFLVPRYGRVIATGYANRLDTPDTLWVQQDCWEAFQAAQSAAVPVVGNVVAWVRKDQLQHVNMFGPALCHVYATEQPGTVALIVQPAASISAAELDALRKDAERWRMTEKCRYVTVEAIDAAIAGEKK